jgi:hypothetical protein
MIFVCSMLTRVDNAFEKKKISYSVLVNRSRLWNVYHRVYSSLKDLVVFELLSSIL